MHIAPARVVTQPSDQSGKTSRLDRSSRGWSSRLVAQLAIGVALATLGTTAFAAPIATVDRNGSLVSVEAYAPNIVRVTIALDRDQVVAPPGPGPNAKPDATGWSRRSDATGDVFASSALTLTVDAKPWPKPPSQMERYFAASLPPVGITITRPDGRALAELTGWEMAPHTVNGEKTFRVGASFAVHPNEHYTASARTSAGCSISRARQSTAATITTLPTARASACPSWSPTRAMASSGTTPRRPA